MEIKIMMSSGGFRVIEISADNDCVWLFDVVCCN